MHRLFQNCMRQMKNVVAKPDETTITIERRVPPTSEETVNLSPPHTWTESEERTENDEDSGESRHLFTVRISLPDGVIQQARVVSDQVSNEDVCPGVSLFPLLEGKAPSYLLTAASTVCKQRIFARFACGQMNVACELLCDFEGRTGRVTALALRPAFGPSSPFHSVTFVTKHAASCAVTHIDYTSIPYLGHLPTDILGRSILSLVYAPDVNVVRQAHIDLYHSRGKVVKSVAPLRFVAYNGALLQSETEWSAYVNPWTKRMEMIVARHRIIDAPVGDANVLSPPKPGQAMNVLPPAMAKGFEDELRMIMSKPVPSSRSGAMCQPAPPRPADLGAYIDRLVETLVVNSGNHQSTTTGIQPERCSSSGIKHSVEQAPRDAATPFNAMGLSYTQINCLENVHRLLRSTSRPESPVRSENNDERKPVSTAPLTKEYLMQHTKRYEDEYRETWQRRLKRMSVDYMAGPSAKHARPSTSSTPPTHWTHAQREEYYRSLAPHPPPPPGKNFQITSFPLPPDDTCTPTTAVSVPERASAFTAVHPKTQAISLTIPEAPSVIQCSSEPLMVAVPPSRLLFANNCQQPLKVATDALMMLHESA